MTKKREKRELVGRETAADVKPKKSYRDRLVDEAKKQGVTTDGSAPADAKPTLPGMEDALKPMVIREGKMLVDYVRPHYVKDDAGSNFIELEFSFPIANEHAGYLPKSVDTCWKFLNKRLCGSTGEIEVGDQTFAVYLAPDVKPSLRLVGVHVKKAKLSWVKVSGSGKSEKVLRFTFRVSVEAIDAHTDFADTHYGQQVWIEMGDTQAEFPN